MKFLVCGAGGFIGHHLGKFLKTEYPGSYVVGVDLKLPRYECTGCDEFIQGDLRDSQFVSALGLTSFDRIYQLAADMGGAGFVFTGDNDADIMHNSAQINLNILDGIKQDFSGDVFYSSSACMYPEHNQLDENNPNCAEGSAYPADPDSEYGWEKLFSERMYLAYARNYGISVKIARFHNVFGPLGSWNDGREKAPAALCRKVVQADGEIEVWGDGEQTRSFLFITECLAGVESLMLSGCTGPYNIGSSELISINNLARMIIEISGIKIKIKNIPGPVGVRGRASDNRKIKQDLDWEPNPSLKSELKILYEWIASENQKS